MRRLLLCANPAASGFTGGLHRDVVAKLKTCFDVEAEWPKEPQDTTTLSSAAAADGVDIVAAMGGDGVVHHVANGVGGTSSSLAMIPAGTTNVLARLVGIPARPSKATDLICDGGVPRTIPSAQLALDHGSGEVERRLATFAVGAGFDAEVVAVAERDPFRKYRFGGVHYARSAAGVVWNNFSHRSPTLEVSSEGRTAEAVAVMVQLHSHYTYFGALPLKLGDLEDGTLTVLVARSLPRRRVARILLGTATARDLGKIAGIEVWRGVTGLDIAIPESTPVQADGELLGSPITVGIRASPDHLSVIAPAG